MGSVFVTVSGPGRQVDLELPGDTPVGEIIPAVVRHCAAEPAPWGRWALGPLGGAPFPPGRPLSALGVLDGAELELRDLVAPDAGIENRASAAGVSGGDPQARRALIVDLTERLIDDIARIRMGRNPLLEYAAPEARGRLRALAPGRLDRAAETGFSDLGLEVSWPTDPRAPVEALAGFTVLGPVDGGVPGAAWPAPVPVATPARRVEVLMTVDAHCRYLLDVNVAAVIPPR
jgi:hypothetical protein